MRNPKRPTKGQQEVSRTGGTPGEEKAAKWFRTRGFSHIRSFKHRHAGPYDITAWKDDEHWIIEVKSEMARGEPKVKIRNLLRMYEKQGYDVLGLLFVPKREIPLLFELRKKSYSALKAWKTRRVKK